ncbi:uncharacterized mitochondrial protein AtMg00810-like [Capsicum annuum]|uniref:uncharacterized mitochondrial protein AtMg00810-like n=1 Tax=Capsicum annuum TaxID=4072 RepID=UPI0007BFE431|nr:uncharacterized mitochondrial protein AtMg00810-like [Capsicum annuum]
MSTIKTLVVVAVKHHWSLFQVDVNNVFLHEYLDEDLYMKLPPGLTVSNSSIPMGSGDSLVILVVYVDDIVLIGTDLKEIDDLKLFLHDQFKIKDLGLLHYFLGIEVLYCDSGVLLHQTKFVHDLLVDYHCDVSSPVFCPQELHRKLTVDMGDPLAQPEVYCSLAALHLLRYLKGSPGLGLFFNNSAHFSLQVFCDSDWAFCPDSLRSVTGFCILLGGNLITWKSKKQPVVSLSSAESEYRSLSKVVGELTWLSHFLSDFGMHSSLPVPVFCDSRSVIHIAKNLVFHKCTKHIELDCHFVWAKLVAGLITLHLKWLTSSRRLYLVQLTTFIFASWEFSHPPT